MSPTSAVRRPRAVSRTLKALVLAGMIVALTGLGASRSNGPPTAILGEVEVAVAGTTPSVQLLDAVCITNTPALDPC